MSDTNTHNNPTSNKGVRVDRWLWAARFFKTRSLAKTAIEGGKVHADGQRIKPAKDIRIGQTLEIRRGDVQFEIEIVLLSEKRGPAAVAQKLYRETEVSIERRESEVSRRRMERAGLRVPDTRPSKKQRRDLARLKTQSEAGSL